MTWWEYWPGYAKPAPHPELSSIAARLDKIDWAIDGLNILGAQLMATTKEVLDAVTALATAFAPLPAAIDALEAAVSAASGLSNSDQANIDAALGALKTLSDGVTAAVTDATDGINKAQP